MSIDYTNIQEHKYTVTGGTTADAEIARFWSKTHQWRIIGLELLITVSGASANAYELYDITNSEQLLAIDGGTSAPGVAVSGKVDANDAVVEPAAIIALREDSTDGSAAGQLVVVTSRTSG